MYLFDLDANPSETVSDDCGNATSGQSRTRITECANLYTVPAFRDIRRKLEAMLDHVEAESVLPTLRWMDDGPLADPLSFGGWVPWRDADGDPLANYAGLAYEDLSNGDSTANSKGDRGERVSQEAVTVGAVSLAETGGGVDMQQLGKGVVFLQISSAAATGFVLGVTIVAGLATLFGYRAGQRSGYHTLGK